MGKVVFKLLGFVGFQAVANRDRAFGEIALPRKCVGEVEFAAGTRDADR